MDFQWWIWLCIVCIGFWVLATAMYFANLGTSSIRIRVSDIAINTVGLIIVVGVLGLVYHLGVSQEPHDINSLLGELNRTSQSRTPVSDRYLEWRMAEDIR